MDNRMQTLLYNAICYMLETNMNNSELDSNEVREEIADYLGSTVSELVELGVLEEVKDMGMNYEEFKNYIVNNIKNYLPDEYAESTVKIQKVNKNNSVVLDGLVVASPKTNVAPTIYLNGLYKQYVDTLDVAAVMEHIARIRIENEQTDVYDVSSILDFDSVKEMIVPRLVSSSGNAEILDGKPHTLLDGMAVIYAVILGFNGEETASISVTNELLEKWGADLKTIHEIAIGNIRNVVKPVFTKMQDVLWETMRDEFIIQCGGNEDDAREMFDLMTPDTNVTVVTNDSKTNGATSILCPEFMDEVREYIGGDFYIIPSSVHECLIMRKEEEQSVEELKAMVREINATEVAPLDILADTVFEYDFDTHTIHQA